MNSLANRATTTITVSQMAEQEARDQGDTAVASDEESEYGLKDLARLPLLEQVHRLFHAIQHKYPYKEARLEQ